MSNDSVMRLVDTDEIGEATVSQLLHSLGADAFRQTGIAICGSHQFTPHAAFFCLQGPHTQRYIEAFMAISQEIEQEQSSDRSSS